MIGAPVLAGTAALRMGSGLVQIAVPRSILPFALSITPELIGLALGKAAGKDKLLEAAEEADVHFGALYSFWYVQTSNSKACSVPCAEFHERLVHVTYVPHIRFS